MNSSTIITTYNSSKTIKPVIENFFKILDHNDELIIVDDGSIDNTKNIIKKYNDKRLKLFESNHIGRAKALNLGVINSSGQVVFINDSDDFSNKLRIKNSKYLIEKGYDAVFGKALIFNNFSQESLDNILIKLNNSSDYINKKQEIYILRDRHLFKTLSLHHSSLAIRREKLIEIGLYNEDLDICIDLDLYYRFLTNKLNVCVSNKIFIARHYGDTRFYSSYPKKKYTKNLLKLRKKYRNILKPPMYTYLYDLKIFFNSFL